MVRTTAAAIEVTADRSRPPSVPHCRVACCLCARPVPVSSDVYALDAEWQRRHPDMVGVLACGGCALDARFYWRCHTVGDRYVPGHLPATRGAGCFDSWHHVEAFGTHRGLVLAYPASAVRQGAEPWLRHVLHRPHLSRDVAARIRAVLAEHDRR